jgi:hypothetical protein
LHSPFIKFKVGGDRRLCVTDHSFLKG